MQVDIAAIKQQYNIVEVVGRFVKLDKQGGEHVGLCPFHEDKDPSLKVNDRKQIFKCYVCGKGGDLIDFFTLQGKTFAEAVAIITDPNNVNQFQSQQKTKKEPEVKWKNAKPDNYPTVINHNLHGKPSFVYPYHNKHGVVFGYVCRFDLPNGKEVLPYSFKTDGKKRQWRWMGFDKPRPLYNLHLLEQNPTKTVIIVEGEKCADAINKHNLEKSIAVAWPGGAEAIKHINFSTIYGRRIILWPDNDTDQKYGKSHELAGQVKPWFEQPGNMAMLEIAEILKTHCEVIKWVSVPAGYPHKWDVADKDWQPGELKQFIVQNLTDVPKPVVVRGIPLVNSDEIKAVLEEKKPLIPPPEFLNDVPQEIQVPSTFNYEHEETPNYKDEYHFKCLGYEKSENGTLWYHFYSNENKSVIKLSPSSITSSNLLQLAPLTYWELNFPGNRNSSISVPQIAQMLIGRSHDVGIFTDKWIRGRGAWMDKKDVVIHAGDHLIVNGKPMHFRDYKSKFIYEIGESLNFVTKNPLKNTQSVRLIEVLKLLNWERDINSYLLAGWCVMAPVCGAMTWRPHIWLTGAVGTGKSWVFLNIVRRILGESALAVQGEATEAGIRQILKHDALPVVFDEAEGEDKRNQDRMQTILSLVRGSSSADGGVIPKGGSNGFAKTYKIRSCFAFASVAVQITQQSDRTRVTILALTKADEKNKKSQWENLLRVYNEVVTDEFCQSLRARTVSILPIILKNAQTFANAAAAVLGEQRTGDQVGALLAGAYSLSSDKEISYDAAVEWIKDKDWSEEKSNEGSKDEYALIAFIMEQSIRLETSAGAYERSIGELVGFLCGISKDEILNKELVNAESINDKLKRYGVKVDEHCYVYFSNSSAPIVKMLTNTPWSKNHHKILLRVKDAVQVESTRFAGTKTRAIKIHYLNLGI